MKFICTINFLKQLIFSVRQLTSSQEQSTQEYVSEDTRSTSRKESQGEEPEQKTPTVEKLEQKTTVVEKPVQKKGYSFIKKAPATSQDNTPLANNS